MSALFRRFIDDDAGATAIEYGLIAAIIGIGIIASLNQVRESVYGLYVNINAGLNK